MKGRKSRRTKEPWGAVLKIKSSSIRPSCQDRFSLTFRKRKKGEKRRKKKKQEKRKREIAMRLEGKQSRVRV